MLLHEAAEEYLMAGTQEGWSEATHRQYRWHLEKFRLWAHEHHIDDVESLTRRALRAWGASIRDRWQPATCRQAVIAVRQFLVWCHAEGLIAEDLSGVLKVPKVPRRIQRTITADEVKAMLAVCDSQNGVGLDPDVAIAVARRNAAIVCLLFDSLLRASELCRLRVQDVNMDGRYILVIGKGGDQQVVWFGEETGQRLRAWLEVRRAAPGVDALFVSLGGNTPGRPLTGRGLRIILKNLGERAGIKGVSPHAFRRGGAVQAIMSGAPSRVVQLMGRWANLEMVERYTRALERGEILPRYSPMDSISGGSRKPPEP